MSFASLRRGLPLALFAILAWSCANDLTKSLDGKTCNENYECSGGYRCDRASLICVRHCEEGSVECNGKCTQLASDPKNCGGCGATCSVPPHGAAVCVDGACNFACPGRAACGDVCVDFQTDPDNCGGCGQACSDPPGGDAQCVAGKCEIT